MRISYECSCSSENHGKWQYRKHGSEANEQTYFPLFAGEFKRLKKRSDFIRTNAKGDRMLSITNPEAYTHWRNWR